MNAKRKIKFVAVVVKWFDKVNGNTYHSVRVTKVATGETIYCEFQYGHGYQYRYTALLAMLSKKWLGDYTLKTYHYYERENNYPIMWNVTNGLKRDCVANGKA